MWKLVIYCWDGWFQNGIFFLTYQVAFPLLGQLEVYLFASSHTNQCQYYYTLENTLPLEAVRLNAFNHPWTYQVNYIFPLLN